MTDRSGSSDLAKIGVWLVLSVTITGSAILAVNATDEVRALHGELQAAITAHDEQMKEQSRLLLERSARAAWPEVEQVATEQLGMKFPATAMRLEP
jgi:cell division protein FtsL